jgi:hypothetical protein
LSRFNFRLFGKSILDAAASNIPTLEPGNGRATARPVLQQFEADALRSMFF